MSKLTSGRVKKLPQSGLTSDRYQFLGLDQAEPDLGSPLIGISSIGAKPAPPGTQYLMVSSGGENGSRYWVESTNLVVGGLSPGTFTVFDNDVQVGLANSFTTFNFVGNGVSLDPVSTDPNEQTGIATVRIAVTDVIAPGDEYQIPYHDPITGFLQGSSGFVFRSDRNDSVGIGTTLTNSNYKLDVRGNVGISSTLYVDEIDVNFIDALNINVGTVTFTSGVGTDLTITNNVSVGNDVSVGGATTIDGSAKVGGDLSVGVGETVLKTENSYVGIGSTQPQHKLDVNGDIKLGGLIYDFNNNTGLINQVLLSTGTNVPPSWGPVTSLTVGNAVQIVTAENNQDNTFPVGFLTTADSGQSQVSYDSDLVYNPSTNRLGIGTTSPEYELDVNGIIRANQLIVSTITDNPLEVNTTSLGEVILDDFLTSTFRSTRYTIQTTVTGQLREGSASIASTTTGQSYILGSYTDVPIVSVTGVGVGALADITVTTETSPLTGSSGGIFTTSNDISGTADGTSLEFDRELEPTDLEQSKLTSINVTNTGAGFTDIPNIIIDSPIIAGNPVDGVGTGVTAVVTAVEMEVTNVVLNQTGVVTSTVPTTTFSSPTSGTAAQGYVGFGVSTFTVTQPGAAYTVSPTVTYDQTPTVEPVTVVGLGISDANIQIAGGTGYNTGITTITVDPPVGVGVTATAVLASVDLGTGAILSIAITNVGSGYTQIPGVTVTNDGSGVGAAITIAEMIVTNIDVTDVGSGFGTSKPAIGFTGGGGAGAAATVTNIEVTSIEVTSAGAGYTASDMPVTATFGSLGIGNTVALGVTSVSATTGLGYTVAPGFTIDAPTITPLTGAALTSGIGFGTEFNISPGPAYGGSGVYYIQTIDANSFRVATDPGLTDIIQLGYDISILTNAYIGGVIGTVTITEKGSGYADGDVLTANNTDLSSPVGTGFTFTVNNLIESYQVSDLLLLQSVGSATSEASVVEYAGIGNIENLGDYDADIFGLNARLKFTPNYAFNSIKISRKGIAP